MAKGDARRLRAALDACGLALLAPKFAEHGVDDSCLSALEDEDLEAMGIAEPASRGAILAVVKAPPETSSERVAALEARNRELADALDAAAAGAAANEARFTEALQIAGRLRDRVLTLEERNDWLEAGKEDYKKRLQSEAAEADRLRRRVDELASSSARLSRCARRERELRLKTTEGRIDPYDGTPLADDGTPLVDPATGLAVDAPEFAPDAPLVSPDAPSPRASSPEDAPEDPEFAAELARAQANVDRMEALKQGRKVSVVDPSHYKTRMCVYLGGRGCPHGANCAFAHSSMELRPPAASTMAEYKTRPCRYSLAECPFAAAGRCQFAHSLDELRPGPATHRQKVEHRYKTKMCKYFLAGHCPYVATGTCQFAHSRDELMAGRGSIHRAEYMNVGPAGTLPRAAFNWRDPTVLAAVGQLGGSFDDVGESAQAWPAPARFGEEAPTE